MRRRKFVRSKLYGLQKNIDIECVLNAGCQANLSPSYGGANTYVQGQEPVNSTSNVELSKIKF